MPSQTSLTAGNLRACSTFLKDVKIEASDFSQTLNQVAEFDFVYMDPPYAPLSPTASFTSYTENGFGKEEQERLKDFCISLHERGALFMLSNSSASWVVNLYRKYTPFRSRNSSRPPCNQLQVRRPRPGQGNHREELPMSKSENDLEPGEKILEDDDLARRRILRILGYSRH